MYMYIIIQQSLAWSTDNFLAYACSTVTGKTSVLVEYNHTHMTLGKKGNGLGT